MTELKKTELMIKKGSANIFEDLGFGVQDHKISYCPLKP